MALTIEELRVLITGETSQLRRELTDLRRRLQDTERDVSKSTNNIRNAFSSIKGALAAAGIGVLFASGLKDAMQFEAAVQQINRLMGESAGVFRDWANANSAAFGMSTLEITKYGAIYGNLLSGFSSGTEETLKRTQDLLKASSVVAAATGRTMQDTMERIRSGLLGNTEAIEDLGINVNVALIESTEAFRQFAGDKSWLQLDFNTQQTIRYFAILEQAAAKYGTELTSNTILRQAAFTAQLKNARLYLGQAFLPIYNTVLPALTAMASALANAMKWLAAFTTALFGSSQVKAVSDQAAAVTGLGGAYQNVGDNAAAAGAGIQAAGDKAKAAAKKIRQSVAGFDKLNLIGNASGAGADDGGAGADALGGGAGISGGLGNLTATDFTGVTGGMDALTTKAREMADAFKASLGKINFKPLIDSLKGLKSAVDPFQKNIGAGLRWFYKEVLVPLGKFTIERALPAFIDVLSGALRVLDSVIKAFKPLAAWLWESFLKPIAAFTGSVVIEALRGIADGLNAISEWINNNQSTFLKGVGFIASFFAAFAIADILVVLVPFLSVLGEFITSGAALAAALEAVSAAVAAITSPVVLVTALIGALIYSFIDLYTENENFRDSIKELGSTWKNALQPLATFVSTVLTDAWNKILMPVVKFFVNTLVPNLITLFKNLWEKVLVPLANFIGTVLTPVFKIVSDLLMLLWQKIILPLAQAIGEVLAEAWKSIYAILTKTVIPIVEAVIKVLTFLWKNVVNPIIDVLWEMLKPAFDTVFSGIGDVIEGLKTVLLGLMKFITGIFTGDWAKAWEGVKSIFKGVFDSLYGIVKVPLNLIIDAINAVIKGLNKIQLDMPDFLGGKSFGVKIPEIPKLAKGGLAYGPTLAMVGDNRGASVDPEVVAPLSKLEGMMASSSNNREVVSLLNSIYRAIQAGSGDLILQVGQTEIGRVAANGINDIQRRTGTNPLRI